MVKFWLAIGFGLSVSGWAWSAQTCNTNMNPTTATNAFEVDATSGTVTHLKSQLVWSLCAQGQTWTGTACSGTATSFTWSQALSEAQAVNSGGGLAGQSDWRLPNVKELGSLVELSCVHPAVNLDVFGQFASGIYWSATPHAVNVGESWAIHFDTGADLGRSRSDTAYVWLVRGGGL